jgi:hypothetical protein
MKRILASALVAAALGSVAVQAQAGTDQKSFNVTATLASACRVKPGQTVADVNFGLYTAFVGPANTAPTTSIIFECTAGMWSAGSPPTVALDSSSGSLVGVGFTLALGAPQAAAATAGTGAEAKSFTITGTMTAGQAGDTAGATSVTRNLTITF